MRKTIIATLSAAVLIAGTTLAMAQTAATGTPSKDPQAGAGAAGAGVPAAGGASNQPNSAMKANPAVTPGAGRSDSMQKGGAMTTAPNK